MIVAVLLASSGPEALERCRRAIEGQTRPPEEIMLAGARGDPRARAAHDGVRDAVAAGANWVWLLDGSAVPEPDALERLLDALTAWDGPEPVLLVGKVVDADGALAADALPWPRLTAKDIAVLACQHRLVSVRTARHGSLLVRRRGVEEHGLPQADYEEVDEDLEWTARLVRDGVGLLAPGSVAVRHAATNADLAAADLVLGNRARMLRGPAWGGEEKLWVGFLLGQDAVRAVRQQHTLRPLAAVVAGLLRALIGHSRHPGGEDGPRLTLRP